MQGLYGIQCLCILLRDHDPETFVGRSKFRNKLGTVNPDQNPYAANLTSMREIQEQLLKLASSYNEDQDKDVKEEDEKNFIYIIDNTDLDFGLDRMD